MNGYTVKEIAQDLNTSRQNVYSLIERNRIKAVKSGRSWHINPAALIEYVDMRLAELKQEMSDLQKLYKSLAIPIDK